MALDGVWVGVIVAAVGVIPGTAATFFAPVLRRREIAAEADVARDRALLETRRELVASWRTGVAEAMKKKHEWFGTHSTAEAADKDDSMFAMSWFVSLYGYLSDAQRESIGTDLEYFDPVRTSLAITEVERVWGLRPSTKTEKLQDEMPPRRFVVEPD